MTELAFTPEVGLTRYLQKIRTFPLLSEAEECDLARRWQNAGDREAMQQLVNSHLRLVARMAMGNRGYGLPVTDLISEGHVGLMQAINKFDPERGFRLSTYARWWIRAAMHDYILRSWSLVKMGTTAAQKKLFFNLRKLKSQLELLDQGDLGPEPVAAIAKELGVKEDEVIEMNQRLSGREHSLNATVGEDDSEWQDLLVHEGEDQEVRLGAREELLLRRKLLGAAMERLNARERHILIQRRLCDDPVTLEVLSQEYNISRERVRQIEVRAFEKVQKAIQRDTLRHPNHLSAGSNRQEAQLVAA
jgi:RNA polymerase sigma-32 factor